MGVGGLSNRLHRFTEADRTERQSTESRDNNPKIQIQMIRVTGWQEQPKTLTSNKVRGRVRTGEISQEHHCRRAASRYVCRQSGKELRPADLLIKGREQVELVTLIRLDY